MKVKFVVDLVTLKLQGPFNLVFGDRLMPKVTKCKGNRSFKRKEKKIFPKL